MSKNIDQVYIANPITTNASTDLMYFGKFPYGVGNDAAMTFANFSAQFSSVTPANIQNQTFNYIVAGGTTNTITLTVSPAITSYQDGQLFSFTAAHTNTNQPINVNVNGLGNVPILDDYENYMPANSIIQSMPYQIQYVGAFSAFKIISPPGYAPTAYNIKQNFLNFASTSSDSPNVYAPSFSSSVRFSNANSSTSVISGTEFYSVNSATNTGASTLSPDNAFNHNIIDKAGNPLTGGEIVANDDNGFVFLQRNGVQNYVLLTNNYEFPNTFSQQTPNTGFSITVANGVQTLILTPAGTLATGTIITPSAPQNGQELRITSTQIITSLTVTANSGQTILNAPSILTPGIGYAFKYSATTTTWYKLSGTGSSPWAFGSGTGSSLGGDGTSVASGNYSLSYGSNTNTASGLGSLAYGFGNTNQGSYSAVFGKQNTVDTGSNYCLVQGLGNQVTNSSLYVFMQGNNCGTTVGSSNVFIFGNTCFGYGSYSFTFGNNATNSHNGSVVWGDANSTPVPETTSNQWNTTFAGGYNFYINNTPTRAFGVDANGNLFNSQGTADQSYSLQVPTTGFSITIAAGVKTLLLNPAGTLLTGTITLPASPIDGQEIRVSSSKAVTTLTVSPNSGQSVVGAPTTLAIGIGFSYIYNLSSTTWYRLY